MVVHELRTPMTAIGLALSPVFYGEKGKISPEQKRILGIGLKGFNHLKRLVDDLVDLSKIEAGLMELCKESADLKELLDEVAVPWEPRFQERGLEFRREAPSSPLVLKVDRDRIVQVFANLIGNALKFTEKGRIQIAVADQGDSVECSVADSGPGIKPEDLPRVFGKFQTFQHVSYTREKGTGLGLFISKGIVELHHGTIAVDSAPGRGTRFTFRLPKD